MDPLFHLVRGHHLYRANLDFLNRPLFRTDRLFRWDRLFLKGQHLHLFPVVLDYRCHQRFLKAPLFLMVPHHH